MTIQQVRILKERGKDIRNVPIRVFLHPLPPSKNSKDKTLFNGGGCVKFLQVSAIFLVNSHESFFPSPLFDQLIHHHSLHPHIMRQWVQCSAGLGPLGRGCEELLESYHSCGGVRLSCNCSETSHAAQGQRMRLDCDTFLCALIPLDDGVLRSNDPLP